MAYHTYLAHLRISGLPRLLDNPLVPPADPPQPAAPWPGPRLPRPRRHHPHRALPPPARRLHPPPARDQCPGPRPAYPSPLAPAAGGAAELDVRAWPPGLYLLTLEADGRPWPASAWPWGAEVSYPNAG